MAPRAIGCLLWLLPAVGCSSKGSPSGGTGGSPSGGTGGSPSGGTGGAASGGTGGSAGVPPAPAGSWLLRLNGVQGTGLFVPLPQTATLDFNPQPASDIQAAALTPAGYAPVPCSIDPLGTDGAGGRATTASKIQLRCWTANGQSGYQLGAGNFSVDRAADGSLGPTFRMEGSEIQQLESSQQSAPFVATGPVERDTSPPVLNVYAMDDVEPLPPWARLAIATSKPVAAADLISRLTMVTGSGAAVSRASLIRWTPLTEVQWLGDTGAIVQAGDWSLLAGAHLTVGVAAGLADRAGNAAAAFEHTFTMMALGPPARQFSFGTATGVGTRGSVTAEADSACDGGACVRVDVPTGCGAGGVAMRVAIRGAAAVRIRLRASATAASAPGSPFQVVFHPLDSSARMFPTALSFHAGSTSQTWIADWQTTEVEVPTDLVDSDEVGVSLETARQEFCPLQGLTLWIDTLDLR